MSEKKDQQKSNGQPPVEGDLQHDIEWVKKLLLMAYGERRYGKITLNFQDGSLTHVDNHTTLRNPRKASSEGRERR